MDEQLKTWERTERSVTLTNDEWSKLVCYILMTTKYREDERDGWMKLAAERNPSGTPVFPNAQANADYWTKLDEVLVGIKKKIDGRV